MESKKLLKTISLQIIFRKQMFKNNLKQCKMKHSHTQQHHFQLWQETEHDVGVSWLYAVMGIVFHADKIPSQRTPGTQLNASFYTAQPCCLVSNNLAH